MINLSRNLKLTQETYRALLVIKFNYRLGIIKDLNQLLS